MIRRVVLLRLAPEAHREEVARRIQAVLATVPSVHRAEVGVAVEAPWDLHVSILLPDEAAGDAYLAHGGHAAFVRDWLAPRTLAREVWTFNEG